MKTRFLIIIGVVVSAMGIIAGFSLLYSDIFNHYTVEIHGMKESYTVGETYSFYFTESGYGDTCGELSVSFPDQNSTIQTIAWAHDCVGNHPNTNFNYDSRAILWNTFSLPVPNIPGRYNVTVSVENAKPAVYKFTVELPQRLYDARDVTEYNQSFPITHKNNVTDDELLTNLKLVRNSGLRIVSSGIDYDIGQLVLYSDDLSIKEDIQKVLGTFPFVLLFEDTPGRWIHDGPESEPTHDDLSNKRIKVEGDIAEQICAIMGGECPSYYIGNIQDDGAVMVGVTISEQGKETFYQFFIRNDTLSYEVSKDES